MDAKDRGSKPQDYGQTISLETDHFYTGCLKAASEAPKGRMTNPQTLLGDMRKLH